MNIIYYIWSSSLNEEVIRTKSFLLLVFLGKKYRQSKPSSLVSKKREKMFYKNEAWAIMSACGRASF